MNQTFSPFQAHFLETSPTRNAVFFDAPHGPIADMARTTPVMAISPRPFVQANGVDYMDFRTSFLLRLGLK